MDKVPKSEIPIWEKYCLSVEEASQYFHIGEERLRRLQHENHDADYLIHIGNRCYFKRALFEKFVDGLSCL